MEKNTQPSLEQRIASIERRNQSVELDKTWETSITRRGILLAFTYISIGIYMSAIEVHKPWLNAIIPSLGFLLSTLALPMFKKLWKKYIFQKITNE